MLDSALEYGRYIRYNMGGPFSMAKTSHLRWWRRGKIRPDT